LAGQVAANQKEDDQKKNHIDHGSHIESDVSIGKMLWYVHGSKCFKSLVDNSKC